MRFRLQFAALIYFAIFVPTSSPSIDAQAAPPKPFTPNAVYSQTVLEAFGQDGKKNCASVALIKGALATYGSGDTNGVFVTYESEEHGSDHRVSLRDGTTLVISDKQIDDAAKKSGFALGSDEAIFHRANMMYAVMAQHAVQLGLAKSFSGALKKLGAGNDLPVDVIDQYLGLTAKAITFDDTTHTASFIYGGDLHVVFATEQTFDQCGTPKKLDEFWGLHCDAKLPEANHIWKFRLTDRDPTYDNGNEPVKTETRPCPRADA